MLNGLEFVSYLIEARRDPPNDCTFLVSEIRLWRSNHHGFLSRAEHGAARGGRAPRAEVGVAMPGVRPHLGAGRRVAQPGVSGPSGSKPDGAPEGRPYPPPSLGSLISGLSIRTPQVVVKTPTRRPCVWLPQETF